MVGIFQEEATKEGSIGGLGEEASEESVGVWMDAGVGEDSSDARLVRVEEVFGEKAIGGEAGAGAAAGGGGGGRRTGFVIGS